MKGLGYVKSFPVKDIGVSEGLDRTLLSQFGTTLNARIKKQLLISFASGAAIVEIIDWRRACEKIGHRGILPRPSRPASEGTRLTARQSGF